MGLVGYVCACVKLVNKTATPHKTIGIKRDFKKENCTIVIS